MRDQVSIPPKLTANRAHEFLYMQALQRSPLSSLMSKWSKSTITVDYTDYTGPCPHADEFAMRGRIRTTRSSFARKVLQKSLIMKQQWDERRRERLKWLHPASLANPAFATRPATARVGVLLVVKTRRRSLTCSLDNTRAVAEPSTEEYCESSGCQFSHPNGRYERLSTDRWRSRRVRP